MYENTLKTGDFSSPLVEGKGVGLVFLSKRGSLRRERSSEKLKRPSTQRERDFHRNLFIEFESFLGVSWIVYHPL